jgi:hypothetical protein
MKEYAGKVLIFVENIYPLDIRVRNEATALTRARYNVSVTALKKINEKSFDSIDGINVYSIPEITLFKKTNRNNSHFIHMFITNIKSIIGYVFEYS